MNRGERRRQERAARKAPSSSPFVPRLDITTLKTQLQQATSPETVRQLIAALVTQGLPPVAGEELKVYAAQFHETAASLRSGESAETVTTLVDHAHAWADTVIDRSPQRDQRACRAGCAFCCYLPVVLITAAEVVHLAAWLRIHCSTEELTALQQRLADRSRQAESSSSTSAQVGLPCALLRDNRCLAYPARPLKCRGWTSMSREVCEQAYGPGQSPSQVPVDAYAFIAGNAVLNGLSDGAMQAGVDGASYDLTFALARALEIPDVVQRWRKGERLFDEGP